MHGCVPRHTFMRQHRPVGTFKNGETTATSHDGAKSSSRQKLSAHPTGGAPINLSSPYSLKVNGDTVVSYLPFFGRAYSVPYGGGKGLNFTGKVISYETSRNKKEYNIKMGVDSDEDQYIYYIDVYENGRAVILVASKNRSNITFYGEMDDQNLSAK